MTEYFDVWRFLAGLGVFLLGMHQLEQALADLAGPAFRDFLRRKTRNPLQGIVAGTTATAVLQSSSVVSLIVLAFVGAGVINLQSALGVVIGANLGTTVTGWIVATLGFKLELEALSLPLLATGAMAVVFLAARPGLRRWGQLVLGLGLLLLGLLFMKESIAEFAANFDVGVFSEYGAFTYLVVGFLLAAVIRSSSGTMMMALGALDAGVIDLYSAAALAIGADLGTTTTVILGALQGAADKKRVAAAHFLFNLVTDTLAFLALPFLLSLVVKLLGPDEPLYSLVLFHSMFNFLGILLFLPFLGAFARFLSRRFTGGERTRTIFIGKVPVSVPEAALDAIELEVSHLIGRVISLNMDALHLQPDWSAPWPIPEPAGGLSAEPSRDVRYEEIKEIEGEILAYGLELQEQPLPGEISSRLDQLLQASRHSVHAAKNLKDVTHNLHAYRRAGNEHLEKHYQRFREEEEKLYRRAAEVWRMERPAARFEALAAMAAENTESHDHGMRAIYSRGSRATLSDVDTSTLLNVNRELYSSNKALLLALKEFLLDRREAEDLGGLPGMA